MKVEKLFLKLYRNEISLSDHFPIKLECMDIKQEEVNAKMNSLHLNCKGKTIKKLNDLEDAVFGMILVESGATYLKGLCLGIRLMSKIKVGDTYERDNSIL